MEPILNFCNQLIDQVSTLIQEPTAIIIGLLVILPILTIHAIEATVKLAKFGHKSLIFSAKTSWLLLFPIRCCIGWNASYLASWFSE